MSQTLGGTATESEHNPPLNHERSVAKHSLMVSGFNQRWFLLHLFHVGGGGTCTLDSVPCTRVGGWTDTKNPGTIPGFFVSEFQLIVSFSRP